MERKRSLQFKSRHTDNPAQPEVDWNEVERTLREVDPNGTISDPRFDPLKYALRILGSVAAEKELNELREHWLAVDTLVDSVVDTHYSGFNKSLQNYSQILRLFSESRAQLAVLQRTLELAQTRLRPQPQRLKELYRRDLMLADVRRLLEDVQAAVSVPDKVRKLEQKAEWSLAVSTLLDGCNKVAREELAGVGALRSLREGLAQLREYLLGSLTVEIERRVYEAATPGGANGPGSPPSLSPQIGLQRPGSVDGGGKPRPRRTSSALDNQTRLDSLTMRRPTHRRTATYAAGTPGGGGMFSGEGNVGDPEGALHELVTCIAQLGGVNAALRTLRSHMPGQIRGVILEAMESFPRSQWLPEEGKRWVSTAGVGQRKRDAATTATTTALMEAVARRCTSTLQSLATVMQLLATARPPATTAGLQMLLTAGGNSAAAAVATPAGTPPRVSPLSSPRGEAAANAARAIQEARNAWECMQLECQTLVAAVLGAPLPASRGRGTAAPDLPGGGWLATVGALESEDSGEAPLSPADDVGSTGQDVATIAFSFSEETSVPLMPMAVNGDTAGGGGTPQSVAAAMMISTGASTSAKSLLKPDPASLLPAILGKRHGKAELIAAMYKPMTRLADEAENILVMTEVAAGGKPSTPTSGAQRLSALLNVSIPWRSSASSSRAGTPTASDAPLRTFLDDFLRMEFLPAAYVSTRARCRVLLEQGDALKPRIRLRGTYRPGAAVLPAATSIVEMAEEVLEWAASAPPFATHLSGVLENVLARVLEAFQTGMASIVGGSVASVLADDVRVVQVMAKEPAAPLLGAPVAFFVGRNVDAMDAFVSSAIATGFGSSQRGLERELVGKVLAASRSAGPDALLAASGESGRVVQLAALAESADHVADTIHAAAAAAAFQSVASPRPGDSPASGGKDKTPTGRRADLWRRHLPASWKGQDNSGVDRGFAEGLAHAADRYRALAGRCIRTLRLELIMLAAHHLKVLPRLAVGGPSAAAAEDQITSLARVVTQLDEALAPYLPPDRRLYVFGSLPPAVVQLAVGMLPKFSIVDSACVSRVCRVLSALQPVLCAAGGVGDTQLGPGMPDPTRQLEKAKFYYSLLTQNPDTVVATAAAKSRRFSAEEYMALLNAHVPGRRVTAEHKHHMQVVLQQKEREREEGLHRRSSLLGK